MASLLHLNGPPGIGKSTLSALYADRHPGTLNLDLDLLHPLVGGWRDASDRTHALVRPLGLAMASAHLAAGQDVVLPQYLGRLEAVRAFEDIARSHGARFVEVVLLDERTEAISRFDRRRDDSPWGVHNREVVARGGGSAMLAAMYDQLLEVLRSRPSAVVVRSEPGQVESTYAAVVRAADDHGADPSD